MYNDSMEKHKRAIRRTYKWYTGERTDGTATISDVAKFFNIPIDKERENDYVIVEFDAKSPTKILISDNSKGVGYSADFTYDRELLNSYGGEVCFVSVRTRYSNEDNSALKEGLYYIGSEEAIIEKLTLFRGDGYRLEFEKEGVHSASFFISESVKFAVRLNENVRKDDNQCDDRLLTRTSRNNYHGDQLQKSFEQTSTFACNNSVRRGNDLNKYCYYYSDNVIYGINDLNIGNWDEDNHKCIRGICFENRVDDISRHMPMGHSSDKLPQLTDENVVSAMRFWGAANKKHFQFEIIKTATEFKVKIHTRKFRENIEDEVVAEDKELFIPSLSSGPITSQEIAYLNAQLTEELDNEFDIVISELIEFGQRLDFKHNLVLQDIDALNPRLYLDKPFDETVQFVLDNQKELFEIALAQFEELTNSQKIETSAQRILKPTNHQVKF